MAAHKPIKIILVEDDPTMQNVLRTLLEIEGYQVVPMSDRKREDEAIVFFKQETPDILLLDVHLLNINGIDLLKRLRADSDLKDLRVVMTSGMDLKDQCLDAGANGFLLKPYMPDELMRMLQS